MKTQQNDSVESPHNTTDTTNGQATQAWKLEWDSPLHLKRLARELNSEGWQRSRAFYCDLGKFNQARFSKGALQVRMCRGAWTTIEGETVFDDGNGNSITVARIIGKIPALTHCDDCGKIVATVFPLHDCTRSVTSHLSNLDSNTAQH